MSPPSRNQVCAVLPPALCDAVAARAQAAGITRSAAAAELIELGINVADRPDARLTVEVMRLEEAMQRLSTVTGRRTPCGAWWAPSPEALPDPAALKVGEVVATPLALSLVGEAGSLTIDAENGAVTLIDSSEVAAELTLQSLAELSALIQPSLIGLSRGGADRRELGPCGLVVIRRADGAVGLELAGHSIVIPARSAWLLAAEVAGLTARALAASVEIRQQLNAQLEVVP